MWRREVNLERENPAAGRERPLQTEMGRGRIREKQPSPKGAGEKVENWKQPQGLNQKGRKEKGEGFNSTKTINKGSAKAATRSSLPGGALVGRANPQEQSGVWDILEPHGKSGSTAGMTFGRDCWSHLVPADPRKWPHSLVLEQGR